MNEITRRLEEELHKLDRELNVELPKEIQRALRRLKFKRTDLRKINPEILSIGSHYLKYASAGIIQVAHIVYHCSINDC